MQQQLMETADEGRKKTLKKMLLEVDKRILRSKQTQGWWQSLIEWDENTLQKTLQEQEEGMELLTGGYCCCGLTGPDYNLYNEDSFVQLHKYFPPLIFCAHKR